MNGVGFCLLHLADHAAGDFGAGIAAGGHGQDHNKGKKHYKKLFHDDFLHIQYMGYFTPKQVFLARKKLLRKLYTKIKIYVNITVC